VAIIIIGFIIIISPLCNTTFWRGPAKHPETEAVLASFENYCEIYRHENSGRLPSIEDIHLQKDIISYVGDNAVKTFQIMVSEEQPYKNNDIYILKNKRRKWVKEETYLYTNILPDEKITEGYYYIYACSGAFKEIKKGLYIARQDEEYHNHWVILALDLPLDDRKGHLTPVIHSNIPPFPGCLLDANNEVYYPSEMLSALKKYYPNINIPEDKIIR